MYLAYEIRKWNDCTGISSLFFLNISPNYSTIQRHKSFIYKPYEFWLFHGAKFRKKEVAEELL